MVSHSDGIGNYHLRCNDEISLRGILGTLKESQDLMDCVTGWCGREPVAPDKIVWENLPEIGFFFQL